ARQARLAERAGGPETRAPLQPGPDDRPDPGRRGSAVRLWHRPAHHARLRTAAGAPNRRRPPRATRNRAGADRPEHRRPSPRLLRRAGRERPEAQPRPRLARGQVMAAAPAPAPAPVESRRRASVFSRELVVQAIWDSFPKLDPRLQVKNPVMFIVELGSVI